MSRRPVGANVIVTAKSRTRIMPKECPLCGTTMRLRENETIVRVPGNPSATTRRTREWVCPECDYFEEADEERET